jgi:hypothetical protein
MKSAKKNTQIAPSAYMLKETADQTSGQKVLGFALRRAFSVSPDEPMSANLQETIARLKQARGQS